ncbi:lipoxygenase [Chytriomyces cf. hyalinus JEL632]|nr:lipoxygenase [Chytriomyces cf. hyalinus JEL632]
MLSWPWAEDTRDFHKVVITHVTRYVDMFYTTDDIAAADAELQAWIKDCHSYHLNNQGLASELKSKSQKRPFSHFIHHSEHSSINYPQYDYYSYPPSRSGKSQMSLPKARSDPTVTESTLAEFFPPISEMELAINTVQILATYEAEDVFLGERGNDYFGPDADAPVGVLNHVQADLAVYNERVKQRNRTLPGRKENPYEWLLSTNVVNTKV